MLEVGQPKQTVAPASLEKDLEDYRLGELNKDSLFQDIRMLPSELLIEIMATCHSLTAVRGNMIGIKDNDDTLIIHR